MNEYKAVYSVLSQGGVWKDGQTKINKTWSLSKKEDKHTNPICYSIIIIVYIYNIIIIKPYIINTII